MTAKDYWDWFWQQEANEMQRIGYFKPTLRQKYRLWKSRTFGPPVGQWENVNVKWHDGHHCAWRITMFGDYEYRSLTPCEVNEYISYWAW